VAKVEGREGLRAALMELPQNLQKNAMRIAIQEAAKVMAQGVEAVAPLRTEYKSPNADFPPGALIDSIKARRRRGTSTTVRSSVDMLFYGYFIEKGWTLTGHEPGKKVIRHIPGRPFVLPGFLATKDRAIKAFADVLREQIRTQPIKAQARAAQRLSKMVTERFGGGV
jgi:hypothetical protein